MDKSAKKKTVYTAQSKYYYFAKMMITKYVLEHNAVPLNPFNNWGYFMDDMVDRDLVICANNNLIYLCDEIWVFGPIADGVLKEIRFGASVGKKVKFFTAGKTYSQIEEISVYDLIFEPEVLADEGRQKLILELLKLQSYL